MDDVDFMQLKQGVKQMQFDPTNLQSWCMSAAFKFGKFQCCHIRKSHAMIVEHLESISNICDDMHKESTGSNNDLGEKICTPSLYGTVNNLKLISL